jgi:ferric-dicitrate binding protein FerR (iron transport regulator)
MNSQEIKELLEKYYLGETTLEEDREIKYFLENDQTNSYQSEKAQFLFYQTTAKEVSHRLPTLNFEKAKAAKSVKFISIQTFYRLAAILIIAVGLGYSYVTFFHHSMTELVTQTNTLDNATLPDGTHVWLGRYSKLRYPPVFDIETREVFLEGEAYFEVAKNPHQPFIVHASQTTTKVVGTAFNLRSYHKEDNVELSVFSGKVLFGAKTKMELTHNDQSIYHKDTRELKKLAIKNANTLAWKNKTLVFENAPLKDVFTDLARYFNIKIEVNNQELLKCHFNGNFKNPSLKAVLAALSYSMNLKYELVDDVCLIVGQGCG